MHPFSTHQPLLLAVADKANKLILECGVGEFSTINLLTFAKRDNGKLISCETDIQWANKFRHLEGSNFEIVHIKDWCKEIKTNLIFQLYYSLVFVDCHPYSARLCLVEHMLDKCDYLVLHDSMHLPENLRIAKYMQEVGAKTKDDQGTLVMSNFYECNFKV